MFYVETLTVHFYRPHRSCEDYVFTPVRHSVQGGSASVHAGITPPVAGTPPWSRHPPWSSQPPSRQLVLRTVRILLEYILIDKNDQLWFNYIAGLCYGLGTPKPMATFYLVENVHNAQTQTWIPTPHFCILKESDPSPSPAM